MKNELTGLGRMPSTDERNAKYPLPRKTAPKEVRRKFWYCPGVLDQGSTSQCVAYSGYNWLRAGPITNPHNHHGALPFVPAELYQWAQDLDEWPGNDYDGTSALGLMKAFKEKGYVTEYRWATDAETIVHWLLTSGPLLFGTYWYHDMFMPTEEGFIEPTGEEMGGHEYLLIGADRDRLCPDGSKGAVRMINSWGVNWGQCGRAWIKFSDVAKLLQADGDCVTATEVPVGR